MLLTWTRKPWRRPRTASGTAARHARLGVNTDSALEKAARSAWRHQTLFALGPLCGIGDLDCVIDAVALCDGYGLDAIGAGGTIAWAMEASERGVLPEADAAGLRFGRGDRLLAAIHAIGGRAGIGDFLAEGSRRAAAAIRPGRRRLGHARERPGAAGVRATRIEGHCARAGGQP